MSKRRIEYGLGLLAAVSVLAVPLCITCVVLASESPMPLGSYVRMAYAGNALLWIFLAIQASAGCLLLKRFPAQKMFPGSLLRLIGFTSASLLSTFICGLVVLILTENSWSQLARKLFL
jgi:hypothetical protein